MGCGVVATATSNDARCGRCWLRSVEAQKWPKK